MRPPVKLGPPKLLFGTLYGKSASIQSFANERTKTIYDYVVFGGPPLTTVVFALTDDGVRDLQIGNREVIAVKQFRHGADDFMLELPGGVPQDGETDRQNAQKELLQETGYSLMRLVELTPSPIYFDPASWTTAFQPFLADGCSKDSGQNLDSTEDIEVVKVPIPEWLRLIEDGEVRDAKSIVTTHLAMSVLRGR